MNSQKFIVGGIVGGIIFFLLGYVFYGLLLKDFFANNGMAANMDTMIWWAMIVGNLVAGFLIAYILVKANVSSPGAGAGVGFVVGMLTSGSFDLINYGIGHGMTLTGVLIDILVGAVIAAITGAVIGGLMRSKKAMAAA